MRIYSYLSEMLLNIGAAHFPDVIVDGESALKRSVIYVPTNNFWGVRPAFDIRPHF